MMNFKYDVKFSFEIVIMRKNQKCMVNNSYNY